MKGIILHGGYGTRLRPLTHTGPKQLLPIANKPMSEYGLNSLKNAGISDIMIVIGGIGKEKVIEYYKDGKEFDVKISYVEQSEPKGISHAINLCKDFVRDEKFVVFLGDNIINQSIDNFTNEFKNSDDDAMILLTEVEEPSRFGIAEVDNNGKITKIIEKPKETSSNLAVTGIYFLTNKIFSIIDNLKPSWRNELEITDALQVLLENNGKIKSHIITGYWKDTGTPEDIIQANREILERLSTYQKGIIKKQVNNNEIIIVGKNSIIDSHVELIGPLIIGENCKITQRSRIGPNVSIGNNCSISGIAIRDSIIMDNCEIRGDITINSSIISKNSKVVDISTNEKIFLLGENTEIKI